MSNDLISRHELKTAFSKEHISGQRYSFMDILKKIDEIPTVESQKEIVPVCKVEFDKEQLQKMINEKVAELEIPNADLVKQLTELCNRYCKNCPIPDVPDECTDCIITHIRGIMKG